MKLKFKNILLLVTLGSASVAFTSCNSWLDLKPISQITPDGYYQTPDQVANYLNNYYTSFLIHPYSMGNSGYMFHGGGYDTGMMQLDNNTDIVLVGSGSTTYFGDTGQWLVSTGRQLRDSYFARIRIANYFFEQVQERIENGTYTELDMPAINQYLGEMYFLRAVTYYNALVRYGDFPIITKVLPDIQEELVEASKRSPRNEVARFILQDLDQAISLLQNRNGSLTFQGRRVNKEAAQLFKSRVALFEASFEKYHKGSGRVPGDANWPGASMSYNQGKTFDIDGEINFFLDQAMNAAKAVADATPLTTNSGTIEPEVGTVYNWNPYFEMFGQNDLSGVNEVLMWREYSFDRGVRHRVGYRTLVGDNEGLTRQFVESFLYKDGMPSYVEDEDHTFDDTSIEAIKDGKDDRLRLFVWDETTPTVTDKTSSTRTPGSKFGRPSLLNAEAQTRSITGYQSRKFFTYEAEQTRNDEGQGVTGAPIFRAVEAYLNYIEADYLRNGSLNSTSDSYWETIRTRAGFELNTVEVSIQNTDLSKEEDLGKYSGTATVDETLYNIRRERMNELFGEGLRYTDLIRWRSFDPLIGGASRWIPEGINLWGAGSTFKDGYFRKINGAYYEKQYVTDNKKDESGTIISSVTYECNDPAVNGSIVEVKNEDGTTSLAYKYTPIPTKEDPNPEEVTSVMRLIKVNGEDDAVVSGPEDPRSGNPTDHVRPLCRVDNATNQLYEGYRWHEAYYLSPFGVDDMRYASPDENVATTYLYQNINWPTEAGSALK